MSRSTATQRVLRAWADPKVGLTGVSRFQEKLRRQKIELSPARLKDILRQQPEYALFAAKAPQRRAQARRGNTIVESGVGTGWQMDLVDVSLLATRNRNYRWILTVMDVYSRYAWVCKALEQLFQEAKKTPLRITSDNGKEFVNAKVQRLLRARNIRHFTSQVGDKHTRGIIERFNRTLRESMGRNFVRLGKLHWVQDLPSLVHNYNCSVHSTIRERPIDVWSGKAKPSLRCFHREPFPFVPGQAVRLRLARGIFEKKSGAQQWSSSIFTIARREGFKYIVKNEHGEELKTRYRQIDLSPVPQEVVETHRQRQAQLRHESVHRQQQKAVRSKRQRSRMQRQGLVPTNLPRLRRTAARKRQRAG